MTKKQVFRQVVVLGADCRSKFHVQRVFGSLKGGKRGVFDWQGTPGETLMEYLRRDFTGMFERQDLQVSDEGHVVNRRFGSSHKHAFPKHLSEAELDLLYPAARALHDHWCSVTKEAIGNRLSTLFVTSSADFPLKDVEQLIAARYPQKTFHILAAPGNDDNGDPFGDPDVWTQHLSRFEIVPPLSARALFLAHRLRKNLRFLAPPSWRERAAMPSPYASLWLWLRYHNPASAHKIGAAPD